MLLKPHFTRLSSPYGARQTIFCTTGRPSSFISLQGVLIPNNYGNIGALKTMSILESAFFLNSTTPVESTTTPLSDYEKGPPLSCEQPGSISLCLAATLEPRITHSVSTSTAPNRTSPRQTFSQPAPTCASCIRQGHVHTCYLTSEAACRDPRIES